MRFSYVFLAELSDCRIKAISASAKWTGEFVTHEAIRTEACQRCNEMGYPYSRDDWNLVFSLAAAERREATGEAELEVVLGAEALPLVPPRSSGESQQEHPISCS